MGNSGKFWFLDQYLQGRKVYKKWNPTYLDENITIYHEGASFSINVDCLLSALVSRHASQFLGAGVGNGVGRLRNDHHRFIHCQSGRVSGVGPATDPTQRHQRRQGESRRRLASSVRWQSAGASSVRWQSAGATSVRWQSAGASSWCQWTDASSFEWQSTDASLFEWQSADTSSVW